MSASEIEDEAARGKPITYFMKNPLQKAWQIAGEKGNQEDDTKASKKAS